VVECSKAIGSTRMAATTTRTLGRSSARKRLKHSGCRAGGVSQLTIASGRVESEPGAGRGILHGGRFELFSSGPPGGSDWIGSRGF